MSNQSFQPRIVPWIDWDEWMSVFSYIFSNAAVQQRHALEIVSMWRCRGRIPHSVDMTASLVEVSLNDSENVENSATFGVTSARAYCNLRSDHELRLQYALAIIRAVNGLVDPGQQGYYAESIFNIASKMGLPGWIVELRHDSTHNSLPVLSVLRTAARHLLDWIHARYWQCQYNHLQTLSIACLPQSSAVSSSRLTHAPTKSKHVASHSLCSTLLVDPLDVFKDACHTLLTDIYVPLVVDATVCQVRNC